MITPSVEEREAIFSAVAANNNKNKNNKEKDTEQELSVEAAIKNRSKQVAAFYGLEVESSSQTPPLGATSAQPSMYLGYIYKYKSGFLSDVNFKAELERIMTSGLNEGNYIPIAEWQTFTREGDCVIAIKYLEKVNIEPQEPLFKEYKPKLQTLDESFIPDLDINKNIVDVKGDK